MSRRGTTDRTVENQQTIKNLLKLEGNKICADCKRNKHPRWASWNIGVFICIRCSGIHRGMGTHVSRVKSVDLDIWTDAQLQSVLNWGNSRANKYWEAKLAAGHLPSEAKIENFIRTKYEAKRWVMDGPMPNPSTLDAEGDDDVPLSILQEKAKIERSASERQSAVPNQAQSERQAVPAIDLFGDDLPAPPPRPSTTDNAIVHPQPKTVATSTTRQTKQGDSLLGLDFFDRTSSSQPVRPSSASANPLTSTGQSRPDLKQSILSLYSAAPKVQSQALPLDQQPSISRTPAQSPHTFGGLADAFGGLSFRGSNEPISPPPPPKPSGASVFATSAHMKSTVSAPQLSSPPPLSGGSFFDTLPSKSPEQPRYQAPPLLKPSNGLDPAHAQPSTASSSRGPSAPQDLPAGDHVHGFASTKSPLVSPPTKVSSPSISPNVISAFNLSAPPSALSAAPPRSTPASRAAPLVLQNSAAVLDPWSTAIDNNAWGTTDPAPAPSQPKAPSIDIGKMPAHITPNDISSRSGEPISSAQRPGQTSSITPDEDYGGWTSAPTDQTQTTVLNKPNGGFGSTADPFDNPWG